MLVFQGCADSTLTAYHAAAPKQSRDGEGAEAKTLLTLCFDATQYVSVLAGRGSAGRLHAFKLDGDAPMPALPPPAQGKRRGAFQ